MFDSNDGDQESSDAQTLECPDCGESVTAITRRGPMEATAQPCGCSLAGHPVRELQGVDA